MRYCTAPGGPLGPRYPGAHVAPHDPRLPRRRPRRRCGHPPVAAVARRPPEVPARPDRLGPHAAAGDGRPAAPAHGRRRRARRDGRAARARRSPRSCPSSGAADVLAEPSPRDSMAAIGLAAAVLLERHGEDVVLGSFAADHVIDGAEAFERTRARGRRRGARRVRRDHRHRRDRPVDRVRVRPLRARPSAWPTPRA